jgi:hypothetical protein
MCSIVIRRNTYTVISKFDADPVRRFRVNGRRIGQTWPAGNYPDYLYPGDQN